jgi:hypothetical protein
MRRVVGVRVSKRAVCVALDDVNVVPLFSFSAKKVLPAVSLGEVEGNGLC